MPIIEESRADEMEFLKNTVSLLTKKLQDSEKKIRQLSSEKRVSKESNSEANVVKFERFSSDTKNREVAKLYAQGYSAGFIYDMLNREGNIHISSDQIMKVIDSIEGDAMEVDNTLMEYYLECRKIFEDKESLNKGFFANTVYKKLKILENHYSECLLLSKEEGDTRETRMILDSLMKLEEKKASIFGKNVLDIFQNSTTKASFSEEYRKQRDKYVKENVDKRKKILNFGSGS